MIFTKEHIEFSSLIAVIDSKTEISWTYEDLTEKSNRFSKILKRPYKSLIFCFCRNDLSSVLSYVASLASEHAVALLDDSADIVLKLELIDKYKPEFVIEPKTANENLNNKLANRFISKHWNTNEHRVSEDISSLISSVKYFSSETAIHKSLKVLLSTSGTTGSPKLVRLSHENLRANALSISDYLNIAPGERAISSLPFHYSYGLSVLNSHLISGSTLVLSDESIMRKEFYQTFNKYSCTSFACVPYSFQILERIKFEEMNLPSLRYMTQAGGKLENSLIEKFSSNLSRKSVKFFVMYGQTEATARISYVPAENLQNKIGSIGIPIPGGKLSVFDGKNKISTPNTHGEIVYEGKNVMLGYASDLQDLSKGDELNGLLRTGDIGYFDDDEYYYISGRIKRISKLYGLRINLDEVENLLRANGPLAVFSDDEKIYVFCENGSEEEFSKSKQELSNIYKLNINSFVFRKIKSLPLQSSGKIDYKELEKEI